MIKYKYAQLLLISLSIVSISYSSKKISTSDKTLDSKYATVETFLQQNNEQPADKFQFADTAINFGPVPTLIRNGDGLIADILADRRFDLSLKDPFARLRYLKDIIELSWSLWAKAVLKGQGFTNGILVIEDPSHKLFNFLYTYAISLNPSIEKAKANRGSIFQRVSNSIPTNDYAYIRPSSHFEESNAVQIGIDMRDNDDSTKQWLPSNKRHLLFGQLNINGRELLFMKFEEYGLKGAEWLGHAASYVKTRFASKSMGKKEHIPEQVKKQFDDLFKRVPNERKRRLSQINPKLIRDMYIVALQLSNDDPRTSYRNAALDYVNYLEKNFDNLDIRRGNEVIIRAKELSSISTKKKG